MSNSESFNIHSELESAAAEYVLSKEQFESAAATLATSEENVDEILARLRKAIIKADRWPTFGTGQ